MTGRRTRVVAIAGSVFAAGAATAIAVGVGRRRLAREGAMSPRAFLRRGGRAPTTRTVLVCAGDSITRGMLSADYTALLARRLAPDGVEVVNAGADGDLAWNVLRRLDDVIACRPDIVTLLVGTNDVNAVTSAAWTAEYVRQQRLPQAPTLDWYRVSVAAILDRLRTETSARVAVLDLPPLGEDLDSEVNARVLRYGAALREVATARDVPVLPLHEHLVALLPEDHGAPRYGGSRRLMGAAIARRLLLRQSWNEISAAHGLRVLTDHVHLNDDAATVVADLIAGFVRAA